MAAANQNLAAAEARFRQARTLVWQARSNWFPTAVVGVSFARSRVSAHAARRPGLRHRHHLVGLHASREHLVGARPVGEDPAAGRVERRRARRRARPTWRTRGSACRPSWPWTTSSSARSMPSIRLLDGHGAQLRALAQADAEPARERHRVGRRRRAGADAAREHARAGDRPRGAARRARARHRGADRESRPPTSRCPPAELAADAAGRSPSACRPTCSSGGPTSPRPSATWRRPTRRSASPCRRTTRRSP